MWKGVGVLGISHSVHQKALLGLLPPWCRELAIVEPSSQVIKFVNTRYDLKRKLKGLELDRFFKTWSARFEHLFGYPFSKRYLENVLCKAYRVLANEIGNWYDTIQLGQLVFLFRGDTVVITNADGDMETIPGKAVINRFPYADSLLTMEDLVVELGLPTTLPSEQRMSTYVFYDPIVHPRIRFNVDFPIPPLPPLSTEAICHTQAVLGRFISERSMPVPRKGSAKKQRH